MGVADGLFAASWLSLRPDRPSGPPRRRSWRPGRSRSSRTPGAGRHLPAARDLDPSGILPPCPPPAPSGRALGPTPLLHRMARGEEGEFPGLRDPGNPGSARSPWGGGSTTPVQPGFFGGTSAADDRAARSFDRVQHRLGSDAVLARAPPSRPGPAERGRLPRGAAGKGSGGRGIGAPWPGRLPVPFSGRGARRPCPDGSVDALSRPVLVDRAWPAQRGTGPPLGRARGAGGGRWAGPWPADERWWDPRAGRRRARFQVLTGDPAAHLCFVERNRWWRRGHL